MTTPPPPRARVQPDIGDEARDLQDSERAQELDDLRRCLADATNEIAAAHVVLDLAGIGGSHESLIEHRVSDLRVRRDVAESDLADATQQYEAAEAERADEREVKIALRAELQKTLVDLADAQATVERLQAALSQLEKLTAVYMRSDSVTTALSDPQMCVVCGAYRPKHEDTCPFAALAARPAAAEEEPRP